MPRKVISPAEVVNRVQFRYDSLPAEMVDKLHSNLAMPSYVHGYSIAIQFMYDWFKSKFPKDYFKGGIFVDGKNVIDDYKSLNKDIIKRINPRARIGVNVQYDYDREMLDTYLAPPNLYLRKSRLTESFFKDYENSMFLGLEMRALRMEFNFKVRVNSRSEQLDLYSRMAMYFRNGSTMHENLSMDFHIPKQIILNIAIKAGFEIKNNEVVDIISFLSYLNSHSDLPFLFKLRAINQKAEYFIRMRDLYTHIDCRDKLQLDDGERDGKLDYNFHVEMNAILTIPIPHFYAFYSMHELTIGIDVKENDDNCIAIYSISNYDIPNEDENGWIRAAITDYSTDKGDTEMDLSSIFCGDNPLAKAIEHDLTKGLSPYHFINIKIYRNSNMDKSCNIRMDWNKKIAYFESEQDEDILHIAIYYDREYINELDIELNKYNNSRITR